MFYDGIQDSNDGEHYAVCLSAHNADIKVQKCPSPLNDDIVRWRVNKGQLIFAGGKCLHNGQSSLATVKTCDFTSQSYVSVIPYRVSDGYYSSNPYDFSLSGLENIFPARY